MNFIVKIFYYYFMISLILLFFIIQSNWDVLYLIIINIFLYFKYYLLLITRELTHPGCRFTWIRENRIESRFRVKYNLSGGSRDMDVLVGGRGADIPTKWPSDGYIYIPSGPPVSHGDSSPLTPVRIRVGATLSHCLGLIRAPNSDPVTNAGPLTGDGDWPCYVVEIFLRRGPHDLQD